MGTPHPVFESWRKSFLTEVKGGIERKLLAAGASEQESVLMEVKGRIERKLLTATTTDEPTLPRKTQFSSVWLATESKTLPQEPPAEFHYFPKLPKELRFKIYKMAHFETEGRGIKIAFNHELQLPVSLSPAPALLSVDRESRMELLCITEKLPGLPKDIPIYFNTEKDWLDTCYRNADQVVNLAQLTCKEKRELRKARWGTKGEIREKLELLRLALRFGMKNGWTGRVKTPIRLMLDDFRHGQSSMEDDAIAEEDE